MVMLGTVLQTVGTLWRQQSCNVVMLGTVLQTVGTLWRQQSCSVVMLGTVLQVVQLCCGYIVETAEL